MPIAPAGKEDSPTTHSELVFALFPTSWQQAGGVTCSELDMFGYGSSCSLWTESPEFQQPHQEQRMEGAAWALARAGQVQELPKGSLSALRWDLCQRPATSSNFVEPGMGSSTPCLNSKASI